MWRHNTESPFETEEQEHVSWIPHLSDFFVSHFIIMATLNLLSISHAQERSGEGITLEQYLDNYDPIGALRDTYVMAPSLDDSITHIRSQIDQKIVELVHARIDTVYTRCSHITEDTSLLPKDSLQCALERYRRLWSLHRQYAHTTHARDKQLCLLIEHILPSVSHALWETCTSSFLWKQSNAQGQKLYEIFNHGLVGQSEIQKQQTQSKIRSFIDAPFTWTLLDAFSPICLFVRLDLGKEKNIHATHAPTSFGAHVHHDSSDGSFSFVQNMCSSDEILSVGCILPRWAKQVSIRISGSFDVQPSTEKSFVYMCDVDVLGQDARTKRGIRLGTGTQKEFSKEMIFAVSTDVDTSFMLRVDVSGWRMTARDVCISVVAE